MRGLKQNGRSKADHARKQNLRTNHRLCHRSPPTTRPGITRVRLRRSLCYELSKAKLSFERRQSVPIKYKQIKLATRLRLDLLVEGKAIIDNKPKTDVTPIDKQQLQTYLRLCDVRLGFLINFNVIRLVDGVVRVVNGLSEES